MTLHDLLDHDYGPDGEARLAAMLDGGADPDERAGPERETALHVAVRRRRPDAVRLLLARGAEIDAMTAGGKTAYAHAVRRGFDDVVEVLAAAGAKTDLNDADRFAVAVIEGRLVDARDLLMVHPGVARTGNPEEDRLLADVAGREPAEPVALLIGGGADLTIPGLDGGTPLHQAAWFGQPANARLLLEAGAPLDVFDPVHQSSPIGWAAHGSRCSGGAERRQDRYVAVTRLLLDAGASLYDPGEPDSDAYLRRLRQDATPAVRQLLQPPFGAG